MRPVRVCIYGGTDLQGTPTGFISALAYKILDSIAGGDRHWRFSHSNEKPRPSPLTLLR